MTATELRKIDCEPPGEDILTRLDELREAAQKGKLSAIAVAVVYRDGSAGHCRSVLPSRPTMLGSIELMKARIIGDYLGDNP